MSTPLEALLKAGIVPGTLFPPNSRYHFVATAQLESIDGQKIVYLRRRFVPPPEEFALLQEHQVEQGDRPDLLAARYLGDPEQYWRLADANVVLRPDELTELIGRWLRITLPHGIPGDGGA